MNPYIKGVSHLHTLDVYRVLELYEVTHPCLQHAIKKLLCAGQRGAKDTAQDVGEAIQSLERWQAMRTEDGATSDIGKPSWDNAPVLGDKW